MGASIFFNEPISGYTLGDSAEDNYVKSLAERLNISIEKAYEIFQTLLRLCTCL